MKRMFDRQKNGGKITLRDLLQELLNAERLDEATHKKVGKYTARRDSPHFQGDGYHAHVKDGGNEYSWQDDGSRRHQGKFGAKVPKDAKTAAASALGIDPNILENEATEKNLQRLIEIIREALYRNN